jgi:NADPH-dependent 2,4-dienoyl-CoA reductase/sulfur reductase-like enzyme
MKTIIIGGVAAGMSAASKIRRMRYDSEVVVYERGGTLSYGACGLPYYVGDEIVDENKMIIRTKPQFEKMGMDIHLFHEVISLNEVEKSVTVKDLSTGNVYVDHYDNVLIASGASPIVPDWEGINHPIVKTLSTIEDGKNIKAIIKNKDLNNVVIIGAGFIGVELVEAALGLEKNVTLIEFKNQILPHLDKEMAFDLETELKKNGASVRCNERVEYLEKIDEQQVYVYTDKNQYVADLVLVCVGVRPNTGFLKNTQIERARNGAVMITPEMKTNVKNVYAAGDCATVYHQVKKHSNNYIPLGTNANKQGKMAGAIICGEKAEFTQALGTSMIKVCDMEGAKTGLSEEEAIMENFSYKTVTIKALNHAPYYPNPQPIKIKLVIDQKTRTILGAQAVGYSGTALRINTFALAIHTKITVDEMGWVDFGYAPPFAEVWDAMHVACNAMK